MGQHYCVCLLLIFRSLQSLGANFKNRVRSDELCHHPKHLLIFQRVSICTFSSCQCVCMCMCMCAHARMEVRSRLKVSFLVALHLTLERSFSLNLEPHNQLDWPPSPRVPPVSASPVQGLPVLHCHTSHRTPPQSHGCWGCKLGYSCLCSNISAPRHLGVCYFLIMTLSNFFLSPSPLQRLALMIK